MILHWDEASCQALQFFLALSPFTTLEEHWLDVSIWKDVRKFSKTQFIQLLFFSHSHILRSQKKQILYAFHITTESCFVSLKCYIIAFHSLTPGPCLSPFHILSFSPPDLTCFSVSRYFSDFAHQYPVLECSSSFAFLNSLHRKGLTEVPSPFQALPNFVIFLTLSSHN